MRGLVAEPMVITLVLAVLGLVGLRLGRAWGRVALAVAFVALYGLGTPVVSTHLLSLVEPEPFGAGFREVAEPGAIVVLAAGRRRDAPEYDGDTVDGVTLERLRYAARVFRETDLPVLVSGGRFPDQDTAIGQIMKEVLEVDFKVPVRWVEDQSRNTAENATLSAALLEAEGIRSVMLVTHAFHMRRARRAFEAAGLEVTPAATGFTSAGTPPGILDFVPQAKALAESAHALHEIVGLVAYRLLYR